MRRADVSRRGFLGGIAGLLASLGPFRGRHASAEEEREDLAETPSDTEGPFYRAGAPARSDLRTAGSRNPPLTLSGTVRAEDGRALAGVLLDLWHTDARGAYDMTSADFRHRGTVTTDKDGAYRFVTNLPGRYGFANGTARPRHIHVKLTGSGLHPLTTQMYFGVRAGIDVAAELCPDVTWTGRGASRAGTGTWDVVLARRETPPAK